MMTRLGIAHCVKLLKGAIEDDRPKDELEAMCSMLINQLELDQTFEFIGACIENDIDIPLH